MSRALLVVNIGCRQLSVGGSDSRELARAKIIQAQALLLHTSGPYSDVNEMSHSPNTPYSTQQYIRSFKHAKLKFTDVHVCHGDRQKIAIEDFQTLERLLRDHNENFDTSVAYVQFLAACKLKVVLDDVPIALLKFDSHQDISYSGFRVIMTASFTVFNSH